MRSVSSTIPTFRRRSSARLVEELELEPTDLYAGEGFTAFTDLGQLYSAVDLPRLKDRPLIPHPVPAFEGTDVWSAIREGDILVHHPVPAVRRRHALRAGGGDRSPRPGHQHDALPREPDVADREGPHHRGPGGQGGRRARRAPGAVRRGGQHPLGPGAGGGGGPRRLRPHRLQDALQGVPGRAPGSRRHPALLPPRDGKLQRPDRRHLLGPRVCSPAARPSARTSRRSSTC